MARKIDIDDGALYRLNKERGLTYPELGSMFNLSKGQVAGIIYRWRQSQKSKGIPSAPNLFGTLNIESFCLTLWGKGTWYYLSPLY